MESPHRGAATDGPRPPSSPDRTEPRSRHGTAHATWPGPDDVDVRLVVTDLDGTLLDGRGRVPDGLWPLLEVMRRRGIEFVPASGRQYATLRDLFDHAPDELTYVSENGALIMSGDEQLFAAPVDRPTVGAVVRAVRERAAHGHDVGLVAAGARAAFVERTDQRFLDRAHPYYHRIELVDDLEALDQDVVKLAVHDFDEVSATAEEVLGPHRATHQVVISGVNWADLMRRGVDKARAVDLLQRRLGVSADQTVVFGDYPNDLGMIREARLSFAMANGHPDVLAAARFTAPANTEDGVVQVLGALLAVGA